MSAHFIFRSVARKLKHPACFGLLALSLVFAGCSKATATKEPPRETSAPRSVRVVSVQTHPAQDVVFANGSLAAQDRAVLSVKVPGRLKTILVDLGSVVRQGDVLAELEKRDFELRQQQAEATLAQARARVGLPLEGDNDEVAPENVSIVKEARAVLNEAAKNRARIEELNRQGIIAEAELETVESAFLVATNRFEESFHEASNRIAILKERRAEYNLAHQQLLDTTIRAPFDGVIEQRQASPGEILREGSPVLTIVRVDPIRLRAQVAERDAPKIRLGQKVILQLEGEEKPFISEVGRLSPVISAENRMLMVEADFANPSGELRPGSFAELRIVVNTNRPALFVPKSAVVTFAGIQKVFGVENGKVVEKEITTGNLRDDSIEIVRGIKAGDVVIPEPGNLRDGQPVQVTTAES